MTVNKVLLTWQIDGRHMLEGHVERKILHICGNSKKAEHAAIYDWGLSAN